MESASRRGDEARCPRLLLVLHCILNFHHQLFDGLQQVRQVLSSHHREKAHQHPLVWASSLTCDLRSSLCRQLGLARLVQVWPAANHVSGFSAAGRRLLLRSLPLRKWQGKDLQLELDMKDMGDMLFGGEATVQVALVEVETAA
jgi:hypothetical protein